MGIPLAKLDALKQYTSELRYSKPEKCEKIKEKASQVIEELYQEVRNADLTLEECNQIYAVLEPYAKLDLSKSVSGVAWLTQKVYTAIYGTPKDNLITLLNEKRVDLTAKLIRDEKSRAREEHRLWIQSIVSTSIEQITADSVREKIIAMRTENPRIILSVQDEIDLVKEQLQVEHKNLQALLKVLEKPLFTFDYYLEAASQKEKHVSGAIVLNPAPNMLTKEGVDQLRIQRLYRLENLEAVYQQTLNRPHTQVASKFMEPTSAWYVGTFTNATPYAPFEFEMQQIGQEHGIKVISDVRIAEFTSVEITENEKTDFMLDCEPILASNSRSSLGAFPQDFVDFSRNGEVRIPAMKQSDSESANKFALEENRSMRSTEWKEVFDNLGNQIAIDTLGAPYNNSLSMKAIALASSLQTTPIMNLTYNEGGNTLIGEKNGVPYALIGKDSYVASKFLMERDLGREMTRDEIMMAFAIDYGMPKENIHFIEQPGDFHLDMSMVIVGDTILLNDSEEAQRMFTAEQEEWYTKCCNDYPEHKGFFKNCLAEEAIQSSVRKKLEDVAEKQLRELGFNVVRVPGRFNYNSRVPVMNFFNMVTAETPSGDNIAVMLGCIGDYADNFERTLRQHSNREIDRVYFLDPKSTQECLKMAGGISCRTKIIPRIGEQ